MLILRNDGGIMRFFCKESTNKSLGEKEYYIPLLRQSHVKASDKSWSLFVSKKKKKKQFSQFSSVFCTCIWGGSI